MGTTVGKLTIDLEAGTYQYTSTLDKAGADAEKSAGRIEGAFNGMDLGEARGSLMVLNEEIGLHLPRHVTALISQLPLLATALEAAFPIIAAVALFEAIGKLIENHDKLAAAIRKAAEEQVDLSIKEKDRTEGLEVQNLKLEDQINKLEGRPAKNRLAEALLEAQVAADALATSLTKDISKGIEVLEEQSGGWEKFKDALKIAFTTLENGKALETTYQSMKNVVSTMEMVQDARVKLADAKTEAQTIAAVKGLEYAYGQLRSSAETALSQIEEHGPKNEKATSALKSVILESAAGMRDMALEQKHLADESQVANLEELHSRIDNLDKQWSATKKVLDDETKETIAAAEVQKEQGKITAQQLDAIKQAALDKLYEATLAHYEKIKKIEAGHPALIAQINAEEQALTTAHNTQELNSFKEILQAKIKGLEELAKANEAFQNKQTADQEKANNWAMKAVAEKNKQFLADAALIQAAGDKHIAQIDKEIQTLQRIITQYQLQGATATAFYNKIHELEVERQKDLDDEMKKSGKLGLIFKATIDEMIHDGQQWKLKVGDAFKHTIDQMNQQLGSLVATGKADWKSLAQSAIGEITQIALQYLEAHLFMLATKGSWNAQSATLDAAHTVETVTANVAEAQSSSSAAAAETLADVPYPENIPASAEVLALGEAYTADASAAGGARLPNRELMVHTHPEEMILPQNISNFIVDRVGEGGGSSNQPISVTYAPNLQSLDPSKAGNLIHAHAKETARVTSKLVAKKMRRILA